MIDNASELATSGTITTSPEGTRRGREMELRERGRVERRGWVSVNYDFGQEIS